VSADLLHSRRNFGLKVGKVTARDFPFRITALVAGHPNLETLAEAMLRVREVLGRELSGFDKRVRMMARQNMFEAQQAVFESR